jgi:hypothetical protein
MSAELLYVLILTKFSNIHIVNVILHATIFLTWSTLIGYRLDSWGQVWPPVQSPSWGHPRSETLSSQMTHARDPHVPAPWQEGVCATAAVGTGLADGREKSAPGPLHHAMALCTTDGTADVILVSAYV